jgi:hypothetical protein
MTARSKRQSIRTRVRRVRPIYYADMDFALHLAQQLRERGWTAARALHFQKGWAVQYYRSGPYVGDVRPHPRLWWYVGPAATGGNIHDPRP